MRRRVHINSNGQPITVPADKPRTTEIEIDCIHCRELRARGASTETEVPREPAPR